MRARAELAAGLLASLDGDPIGEPGRGDLANRYGIEGLIGLNFLRRFNYEIRSEEGRIVVDEIESRRGLG